MDIRNAVKDIKLGKVPGKDKVHPKFLYNLGRKTLGQLATGYYTIFKFNTLSREKEANVVSILKSDKLEDNSRKYRPISLLSVVIKLMKRMILKRIEPVVEKVIPKFQAFPILTETTVNL